MGAANCCKKPEEIVIEQIKEDGEGDKINVLDQDSYPQDTEFVNKANINPEDQEVSNQKLYEQEGSPRIDGAYEVAINASSPVQYKQMEELEQNNVQTPHYENQNLQMQNEAEELAIYRNQNQLNENQNNLQEIVDQYNHPTDTKNEREIEDINEINQNQIKQSNISNSGVVDLATLSSQQSPAPTNIISQMVNTKQIVQTPMSNNKNINIQQNLIQQPVQQINSQIQVKEPEEGEDLNKYFQIPTSLAKSKTTIPSNIDLNNIQKLIGQNQIKTQTQTQIQQQNVGNVASVTPLEGNDDINQYFNQAPYEQTKEPSDQEILKKYFTPAVSHEINPEQINQNQLNLENIINMKDLPQTFGSSNIQQISIKQQQPQTTTTTTVTKTANDNNNFKQITTTTETTGNVDLRNIPSALTSSQINKIIDMKDLPETLGSNEINNFNPKTTTTTTTKTTGNIDLNNLPGVLTSSEIHKIIDMKDLPATFGSNEINNFKQTTTTTTETIGNIPKELTNSEIKKIIDMKDLPETIGSTNMKKTTVTTTTESIGNIPKTLTNSEIKKIIDMKDLPETFGSTNMKKTTVTTTTTTHPVNTALGSNDINNFKQTTTTTTETIGNIPKELTNSEIKKIIDMKDLPETIGSTNMKKTTVTTTTESIGNIPKTLTNSEIKKIIDMKDLPETFGSTNMKKTTVTTTTTTNPSNINIQNLQPVLGNTNINNFKQTTTTTTETIGNIPKTLTNSEIKKIIDMKDLPETIGSTNMKKTTVTTTTTSNPVNIDLKQFGLEQNPSAGPFASESIDLKQFGLEPTSSAVSTAQNKQVKTVTKTVQSTGSIPEQDYTKYFQNVQTTSTPIDLKQFGLEQNASNISNILQGSNITFKQPGQSIISSTNYNQNKTLITPAASSPIIYNDYNKYFKTANTIATTSNQNKVAMSTAVNPVVNYNLNAPYTKTATTTISKKTGIPVSSGAVTTNYTLPANYAGQKVTTSKVTKTYTTPTQISGYNYGYSVPGTTTTTTTYKK